MKRIICYLLIAVTFISIHAQEPVKREMRGVWVATIYGLDWPSVKGTDTSTAEAQRRSMTDLFDRMQRAGLNAIMFQVRTFSDAMYRSNLEPWAAALTGQRGSAPAGDWDPLQFAIEECHKRGMELHAWVNPFHYSTSTKPYTDKYDSKLRPMLLTYTTRPKSKREKAKTYVILDPGNVKARQHVVNVCRDIVSRYDIDGLIFDDYFYPDRLPLGAGYDYNEWKKSGSKLSQADWRRENVNLTVKAVGEMIKEVKPHVAFGISPAGVGGGNGVSASRYELEACHGNDWMYDRIYCDPLAWLDSGDVDYISPQIYWNRDHKSNPYTPIATWWSKVADRFGRHFYASHSLTEFDKAGGDGVITWKERTKQVEVNRNNAGNSTPGSIFYAARNIRLFGDFLSKAVYSSPALPPSYDWKQGNDPGPVTKLTRKNDSLTWRPVDNLCRYAVYAIPIDHDDLDAMSVNYGGYSAGYLLGMTYNPSFTLPKEKLKGYRYAVTPIDRNGHEWEPAIID